MLRGLCLSLEKSAVCKEGCGGVSEKMLQLRVALGEACAHGVCLYKNADAIVGLSRRNAGVLGVI